jgi:hypothetical protein
VFLESAINAGRQCLVKATIPEKPRRAHLTKSHYGINHDATSCDRAGMDLRGVLQERTNGHCLSAYGLDKQNTNSNGRNSQTTCAKIVLAILATRL